MIDIYKPKLLKFETADILYKTTEDFTVKEILDRGAEEGFARVAISGGSTPVELFKRWSDNPIFPWDELELYQVDERYVYPESKESNQKNFIDSVHPDSFEHLKNFYPFETEISESESVKKMNEQLDSLDSPLFDMVVLGVGDDGHFASLFPGGDYFGSKEYSIQTTAPEKYQTKKRLSLTLQTILNSKKILLLVVGKNKKDVVNEMLEGNLPGSEFPVKFLLAHPDLTIYQCGED